MGKACKEFRVWIRETGLKTASELLTAHERSRGRKPVSYQLIQYWLKNGIPVHRAASVSEVTGIDPYTLCPELRHLLPAGSAA